ncbi:MAG: glycosyltransferase family 1 protein [Rickettsiales bacterium]|nr:glycosyltransferase family 1 protein [Rickettsiales bacterium]
MTIKKIYGISRKLLSMRILFNNELFERDHYCGINKYYGILFNNLPKSIEVVTPAFIRNPFIKKEKFSNSIFYQKKSFFRGERKMVFLTFCKKSLPFFGKKIERLLQKNERIFLKKIQKGDFDILHIDFCWLPSKKAVKMIKKYVKKPILLTVHDVIGFYTIPTNKDYFKRMELPDESRILLGIATKIITVSNTTKQDLVRLYNIDDSKIQCVYNCCDKYDAETIKNFELPKKYILHVGQRLYRKNFVFFLNSIREILLEDEEIKLVFTFQEFTDEEKSYAGYLGVLGSCIFVNAESEKNLAYLYKNALVCAVPTLYEGFGMIIAEAMAYGCPVVTSGVESAMKEIGGNAPLYFDPLNQKSIHDVTREVLYNENLRQKMRESGLEQIKKFTPEKMVEGITKIYNSVS